MFKRIANFFSPKPRFIRLTDFHTGAGILLSPDVIASIQVLDPYTDKKRTHIGTTTGPGVFIVKEDKLDILEMIFPKTFLK